MLVNTSDQSDHHFFKGLLTRNEVEWSNKFREMGVKTPTYFKVLSVILSSLIFCEEGLKVSDDDE
jgi:hypothetical protein